MKLLDLWKKKQKPTISFELYPARDEKAAIKLEKVIDDLASLSPDFVSVTFGAGGSTKEGSHNLIDKLHNQKKLEVVAYFAGYGLGPDEITKVLQNYKKIGVENVLAVRGDPPKELEGFQPHPESFAHASDLLAFLRPKTDFCLGAAGYPEGHIEAKDKNKDLEYLKLKVQNGAQFIICNYFYDNQFFFDFKKRCQKIGIEVPILPGIMPIFSVNMMETLANLCGATITPKIKEGLSKIPEGDKEALAQFGIDFAYEQCKELIQAKVPGIHIYTMDRAKASLEIVNRLRKDGLC